MRGLWCLLVASGCADVPDVCGAFAQACISLQVRGSAQPVDQIRVSGLSGFRTVPGNDGASPDPASPVELPVILAVLPPGEFQGPFTLSVRAMLGGTAVAEGVAEGTLSGLRAQASVTLGPRQAPPIPSISLLSPAAACLDTPLDLTITGDNLNVVNSVTPQVRIADQLLAGTGCLVTDGSCDSLRVRLQPLGREGTEAVVVVNPPPQSTESQSVDLHVLPRPEITQLTTQGGTCNGFELTGGGFYKVGNSGPTVRIDGQIHSEVFADTCVSVAPGVQACTHLQVLTSLGAGNHVVAVVAGAPLGCASMAETLPCF